VLDGIEKIASVIKEYMSMWDTLWILQAAPYTLGIAPLFSRFAVAISALWMRTFANEVHAQTHQQPSNRRKTINLKSAF